MSGWNVCTLTRQPQHGIRAAASACAGFAAPPARCSGGRQAMNASFGAFKLVNTYGAFGSVGEARYEPIVEFPCKPGAVTRRPCFCAPYHYRLDWNIWFLGFKPHQSMLQRRERGETRRDMTSKC
ncbi:hypothetical protein EMIHUDRAFT_231911 [Emiliania huxleyi CCMP1516]|uniref:Lipase maturation factor 1/2 C-terminal domain-containing protein n=2 Tax=Emiliania huxleyi TaxID=2903 RepID=A0A0D3K6W5_EMIH1|nr:hypothetical protein EMIHUDRAFT_231911 [Emiliania huxleyi CCMP1516]EOD31500.1 hypothetical protein EMIHUDRAFT_231911 [Emiliania huxleyi CCMP1516]|eukprot:XP_005783929.1 hypothetical protein EMIHUDRAFT_231911 [Emiliania huxleyi CCMP1516]